MKTIFIRVKCLPGQAYDVAEKLADAEVASEIHSTSGSFDLLVKCHLQDDVDPGRFVTSNVQTLPGVADTYTLIAFKAFS